MKPGWSGQKPSSKRHPPVSAWSKTTKLARVSPLGDLLSISLAAFGNPLVDAAPFRDRTLENVSRLLDEGEMPLPLEEDQRQKIWDSVYTALYTAEGETEHELAGYSKIVMLEPGLTPKRNTHGSVDAETFVRANT